MGMKYVAAYLMKVLSGTESPSADDIKQILEAAGSDWEESKADGASAADESTEEERRLSGMFARSRRALPPRLNCFRSGLRCPGEDLRGLPLPPESFWISAIF